VFEGEAIGAQPPDGVTTGEVVFNTAMSGYQEIITDPSYAGQIVTFTYPHIGNYGVSVSDNEAPVPACRGVIVRDLARRASSWRSERGLGEFLEHAGLSGIAGIDTRRLTRHLRDAGAIPGAFGTASETQLLSAAKSEPGTDNQDLAGMVSTKEPYLLGSGAKHIVAYDFGIKRTILRHLSSWFDVEVVPASTSAADVLARDPKGVFLSNGPGDPASVPYASAAIADLLGNVPVFGICLGHQLLARALGADTEKLPFGHHGGNHPVRNLLTGRVEITSQNHNFAVDGDSLRGIAEITHLNLNDNVCEGMRINDVAAFSVQHHPEAGPGPHDSAYLFGEFASVLGVGERRDAATFLSPVGLPEPDAA
jgi:carbamoyl-phosphate synthase small subunit